MYTTESLHAFQLLKVLSDGKVHTYKTLASRLNCPTLYLLRLVRGASRYGAHIDSIVGIGIYWGERFIWIHEASISSYLGKYRERFNIIKFDLLGSTNTHLIENKNFFFSHTKIRVVIAELQTKGRGTHQRTWSSNLGGCLTFSLLWKFKNETQHLPALTLVLGVCLVRVFKKLLLTTIDLKWPNDLLYKNKKFAGILTECRTVNHAIAAIIGIGINFNLTSNLMDSIDYPVTDLYEISGKQFDRNRILALLLIELYDALSIFEVDGFGVFRAEWESYHVFHGKTVLLDLPDGSSVEGVVDGVQDNGSLIIRTASEQKVFNIGEISLKVSSKDAFNTCN